MYSARPGRKRGSSLYYVSVKGKRPKTSRYSDPGGAQAGGKRIFLLSPANVSGIRANLVFREDATFALARRLREKGVLLGEIFSFISGLYFRGKLAYAQAFARPPAGMPGALVITACGGLVSPDLLVTREELRRISAGRVDLAEPLYRIPLERDARKLAKRLKTHDQVVLLGSVATPKYVEPLLAIFGDRLMFPAEFAGRGDMSRGGLMLRCVRDGVPLTYVPVSTGERHGPKPPKLPSLSKFMAPRSNILVLSK